MSEECTHDCDSCGENCSSRIEKAKTHDLSSIKHIIGIISGKGGVGKSTVTSMLAVRLAAKGYKVGIMDADITGPSICKAFGVEEQALGTETGILPAITSQGIQVISTNMLLENPTDPVIWRGPILAGVVGQFFSDVIWTDLDFLLIDMPPGTGDVALTVFQTIPLDGVVMVSSPQGLVKMIVSKAVKMAKMMNVPVLGLVENMSELICPNCNEHIKIFGQSQVEELAKEFDIDLFTKMPLYTDVVAKMDEGKIEETEIEDLDTLIDGIVKLCD